MSPGTPERDQHTYRTTKRSDNSRARKRANDNAKMSNVFCRINNGMAMEIMVITTTTTPPPPAAAATATTDIAILTVLVISATNTVITPHPRFRRFGP